MQSSTEMFSVFLITVNVVLTSRAKYWYIFFIDVA